MMRLIVWSVFACVFWFATTGAHAEDVTLFTTTSAVDAMKEAAEKFNDDTRMTVAVEAASPGVLVKRMDGGEIPHIVVLDGKKWMDELADRKTIVPETRRPLFSNRLVLITHRDFPHALPIQQGLPLRELLGDGKLAIADPKVDPAGELARAALEWLGPISQVEDKLDIAPDVRTALEHVEDGENVVAGIVYATDTRKSQEINIAGGFTRNVHPPIIYEIAIIGAKATPAARSFHEFLLSKEAREIFGGRGFVLE
jgi:molybdate transport system substrate-binding protein